LKKQGSRFKTFLTTNKKGDCDIQYSRCLKYKKDDGAKIGTFFYLCKHYGVNYAQNGEL
jgi:hypothetical protein